MQNFTLTRKYRTNEATLGTVFDRNNQEICKTLENPWLDNRVNISCIPEGIYEVRADNSGRFRYWQILNVSGRSGVEIHQGNKECDTQGCILFGKKWGFIGNELAVLNSKPTLNHLKKYKILPNHFRLQINS
jgi:hypothetical protein